MAAYAGLERRILAATEGNPPRIPVILGGCGTGRTAALQGLLHRFGQTDCQYVDLERAVSTPERFFLAVSAATPFTVTRQSPPPETPREALDRLMGLFTEARGRGRVATFLLDEVLELRTFESFPGLRYVMRELLQTLHASENRFVLTSRYTTRAQELLRDASGRFEVVQLPPLSASEATTMLPPTGATSMEDREFLGRAIAALADGRAHYVRVLGDAVAAAGSRVGDPISALTALLTTEGALTTWCAARYEARLHRARGYGALKGILEILSGEEPLTLTAIAQRLHRTPGSTKDYLSWLEDVDLLVSRQKRYSFADPLLRLWVHLHCRPSPPGVDEVAREVQQYALMRLPQQLEPTLALAGGPRRRSGIVEID